MRPVLPLVVMFLLQILLAEVVAARDPVAVLFATRGLADPVGVAAMAGLLVTRLGLVLGGPGLVVLALADAVRRR